MTGCEAERDVGAGLGDGSMTPDWRLWPGGERGLPDAGAAGRLVCPNTDIHLVCEPDI